MYLDCLILFILFRLQVMCLSKFIDHLKVGMSLPLTKEYHGEEEEAVC